MRLFFRLLYHSFAWSYDLVAAAVSLGRWNDWVKASAKLLAGPRVLELGFGPGHMQITLEKAGFTPFGLDESRQMARQAAARLARHGQIPRLARGLAQHLPFANETFDSVIATFPTQYIVDPQTLGEIYRVLARPGGRVAQPGGRAGEGGRLVVLMNAWITGRSLPERFMRWVFRVTGESPAENVSIEKMIAPYTHAGFAASVRFVDMPGSRLMMILARKQP